MNGSHIVLPWTLHCLFSSIRGSSCSLSGSGNKRDELHLGADRSPIDQAVRPTGLQEGRGNSFDAPDPTGFSVMRAVQKDPWSIIALLALNAVIKFSWLGVNDLSGDEPFTVFWATRPLAEVREMLRTENNPPLYFMLIKAWMQVAPLKEAWLRVPSALFSVLTVWPLFLLARGLGGRAMAVVACLLFTLNNHQYAYAHEVRAYSLLLFLTVLAARLVVRGPSGDPRRALVLLGLVFTGLVWTHFFGWLVVGLCMLCTWVLPELREARRRVLLATVTAVVAFLPYGALFFLRAGESIAHGTWVTPHGPEEIWHMVRRWSNQPVVTVLLLIPLVVAAIRERPVSFALRFALWWWLLPLFGLWLVQWWVPAYVDRYLLFASIGFYLAVAHALGELVRGGPARWVAPAVAVGAMLFTFTPWRDNGQRPSKVAAQVREWRRSPEDPPVLVQPFWYKVTLWSQLDRSSTGEPPWLEFWSWKYNDRLAPRSGEVPQEFIVVYSGSENGALGTPPVDGYHIKAVRRIDPHTRVAWYAR